MEQAQPEVAGVFDETEEKAEEQRSIPRPYVAQAESEEEAVEQAETEEEKGMLWPLGSSLRLPHSVCAGFSCSGIGIMGAKDRGWGD